MRPELEAMEVPIPRRRAACWEALRKVRSIVADSDRRAHSPEKMQSSFRRFALVHTSYTGGDWSRCSTDGNRLRIRNKYLKDEPAVIPNRTLGEKATFREDDLSRLGRRIPSFLRDTRIPRR